MPHQGIFSYFSIRLTLTWRGHLLKINFKEKKNRKRIGYSLFGSLLSWRSNNEFELKGVRSVGPKQKVVESVTSDAGKGDVEWTAQ